MICYRATGQRIDGSERRAMISLWAVLSERDVEAYSGTLVLPSYLAHLRLGPFRFADQPANCDGLEPLKLTYVGEGRVEEYTLPPGEHALPMIRFVCPGIETSRVQLPQDDAAWAWTADGGSQPQMRIYFAPTSQTLGCSITAPEPEEAYVSVSRGHVFIARPVLQLYLKAWLERLRLDDAGLSFDFGTPSGAVEFEGAAIGGQMLLDTTTRAEDLMRFAGLDRAMSQVAREIELDLDSPDQDSGGVCPEGVYIRLRRRGAP
jgi:hypothetical protein